ncbi:MAG: L-aspartate oxidase [Candidatus Hinthialibacter antarcticus]|nr:L-aspartate oxidase [Candidatus Hinthialibacter antarcticus]
MNAQISDILVIGSGVAGLHTALNAARLGRVHLVTKKDDFESNTNYAQGGIASVLDSHDSFDSHIRDTLDAGAGLCHRDAVELIVTHGPEAIEGLINCGVEFTRGGDGELELGREGGHSYRRIVHAKDLTGREVERALLSQVRALDNVTIHQYYFAVDLILDDEGRCWGAWVWDEVNETAVPFLASVTIMCSGGCGLVYQHSTNPSIATGDGVAMGFRAGAPIANMEFIQFHPTAFYTPGDNAAPFLISEAVRGEGAILRKADGDAFMERYHPLKDLAPRDIVARAIDAETKKSGDPCCYLDVSHLEYGFFKSRFPNITDYCEKQGVKLPSDFIPVIPAAHYMCGGVLSDLNGATDITGFYVIGETACTGVHGANRLASNSILEALIFSRRTMREIQEKSLLQAPPKQLPLEWNKPKPTEGIESVLFVNCRQTLSKLMWDYVGIVRSDERLHLAHKRIKVLKEEIDGYFESGHINRQVLELRNLVQTADLIIHCAWQRKESRGLHYTLDYPQTLADPMDSVITRNEYGRPQVESRPIPS